MDRSPHKSDFVNMNGIRLHYLDWGGTGETLLFLTGLGNSAHIFDDFAPRFTDHFRVLALTRRGHGDSDYPEIGYDVPTYTEDIRGFMDELQIARASLVGHSMAYVEQCGMCEVHPGRVSKLVCLDAAYDRTRFKVFAEQNPLREVKFPEPDCHSFEEYVEYLKAVRPDLAEMWNEVWEEEIRHIAHFTEEGKIVEKMSEALNETILRPLRSHVPNDQAIHVPVLSFYAIWDKLFIPAFLTEAQKAQYIDFRMNIQLPVQRECIELSRHNVPHARIVEIPQGNHYCFIAQESLVYMEMRKFLLE